MGMKIATPMRLIPPQLTYDAHSVKSSKDYYKLFQLDPNTLTEKKMLQYSHVDIPASECMDWSLWFRPYASYPAKCYFKLKNGWKITTYGEYDADGNKVRNPSALPWEKNNFNGAFEMKSENGNFGIRIEVQKRTNDTLLIDLFIVLL